MIKYATQQKKPETKFQEEMRKHDEWHRIEDILEEVRERVKRKILRQLKAGEIDLDPKLDKLVYVNTGQDVNVNEEDSDDY